MLTSVNLNDKDYEQLLVEAMSQIPLYSREWTNMNASEPGITILENLSAFEALQQSEMNQVSEKIKWKLLALAGFLPEDGIPAKAYLQQNGTQAFKAAKIVPGIKIYAQNICYELSNDAQFTFSPILGVYSVCKNTTLDLSELTHPYGHPGGAAVFGEHPDGGNLLYLLVKELPIGKQKAIFYVDRKEIFPRNAFGKEDVNPFAKVEWEVLTKDGFVSVEAEDETHQFLMSGYIQLSIPVKKEDLRFLQEQNAYVIRAKLICARYDIVPHINQIQGLLTPVEQIDTQSVLIQGNAWDTFTINHYLLQNGMIDVFVKEMDGAYHLYQEEQGKRTDVTRTYQCIEEDVYEKKITVNRQYIDKTEENNMFVICRDVSIMPYKILGTLYGYDEQVIELPPKKEVYAKNFSIVVVDENGLGHIVLPETQDEDDVRYSVSEIDNALIIHDCGSYEGAKIYLGRYALYQGKEGNVLPGTLFTMKTKDQSFHFTSCYQGKAGSNQETFEEVRRRFVLDIQAPATIVTQHDCEELISKIPGLSIHKMKAVFLKEKNEIHVVIKPNSLDKFPVLSDIYCKAVHDFLEKRRMLSTKIVIEQPRYVPIHVQGMIYVKKHFAHCKNMIEALLGRLLDGFASDRTFGETIYFHEIYHKIEMLECVEEINDLSIMPGDLSVSKVCGLDIQLASNTLFYPGDMMIELAVK